MAKEGAVAAQIRSTKGRKGQRPDHASTSRGSRRDVGQAARDAPAHTEKRKPTVSKSTRDRLAQDDAEIAELERKLGLKGRKNLPKSFDEDGLGDLLGDLDAGTDDAAPDSRKRKSADEDWLRQKRRKAAHNPAGSDDGGLVDAESEGTEATDISADEDDGDSFDSDMDMDEDEDEDMGSDSSEGGSDFVGFSSDEADKEDTKQNGSGRIPGRQRENPYVAPTSGVSVAKYVPPALRRPSGDDAEQKARIRRQANGLLNRMNEGNMLSITADMEKLYLGRDNPRQLVTSCIIELMLLQVGDPTSADTILIRIAAFATAIYKTVGSDFGAQLVQEVVERFGAIRDQVAADSGPPSGAPKELLNLLTFLSALYSFGLVGCDIIFDYIRLFLGDLSEQNADLLLRIILTSGPSLRQDDPLALKDIVGMVRPAVAKIGEQNLSFRAKHLIDTITELKNNKLKAGAAAASLRSNDIMRMKKLLGSLNSRKLSASEPLRIGLKDIEASGKKGKWWLVGASWTGPEDKPAAVADEEDGEDEDDDSSLMLSDDESGAVDIDELARGLKMNTAIRRSIFTAIASATDYVDAHTRLQKLRLNKQKKLEIPDVIIQCVGGEMHYNPYYALVARQLCADRRISWAFQSSLWRIFRRLGESIFDDEADQDDHEDEDYGLDTRRLVNVAKLFASLVADGSLSFAILKCLSLPYLQPKTRDFVEAMLVSLFLEIIQKQAGEDESARATEKAFMPAAGAGLKLVRGLQWFLKKVVRKTDLAGSKSNTSKLKRLGKVAEATLESIQENEATG